MWAWRTDGQVLSKRFYRTLDLALERLRQHPEMAPVYRASYRRLVLQPFGLGVFYAIEADRLMVAPSSIFGKTRSRFNVACRAERLRTPLGSRFGRGAAVTRRIARGRAFKPAYESRALPEKNRRHNTAVPPSLNAD
jgi:hypothetical protein